jgi:hypothetical protein
LHSAFWQKYKSYKNGFDHSKPAISKLAEDAIARRRFVDQEAKRKAASEKIIFLHKNSEELGMTGNSSGPSMGFGRSPGSQFRITPVPIPGMASLNCSGIVM